MDKWGIYDKTKLRVLKPNVKVIVVTKKYMFMPTSKKKHISFIAEVTAKIYHQALNVWI